MMQVGTNQSTTYHSQPSLATSGGQTGRSASTSRQQQQQQTQNDNEQLGNIRPRLCVLRKWPHYDGYGVHLARNQHWLGLRIGDVEPNSPAESGGLLSEDVVLAVNGHSVENDDFFVILSFIQHELEDDQIRFLVLDPHSADLARRHNLTIDENYRTTIRMDTPTLTISPEKLLYDQWLATQKGNPTAAQNTINLGPRTNLVQTPSNADKQRFQNRSSQGGRDDVYTFLPYSDHAVENGKSYFDILFEQGNPSLSTQEQPRNVSQYQPPNVAAGEQNKIDDNQDNKHKTRDNLKDGVKSLVKSGVENIKSVLPTKHNDDKEKRSSFDSKQRDSAEPVESPTNRPESPSFIDKVKNKFRKSSSTTVDIDAPKTEKQPQPYENILLASKQPEDTNNNVRSEPRICPVTLRSGEAIGISLQPDKDFGHIIKQVDVNSAADRAGIENDDCVLSLNGTPLLNIPYDDVLKTLKRSRNEPNLDFLVAKKSYLLNSSQNNATSTNPPRTTSSRYGDSKPITSGEVMPSSNISDRDDDSTAPAAKQTLERLYDKYSHEQKSSFDDEPNFDRSKETVSTSTIDERYDQRSPVSDSDRYPTKRQQQGQILQGVGPATADRSSWGVSSGKSTDDYPAPISGDSSVRSNSRGQRPDTDDAKGRNSSLEESFKPLQVGITNPTPTQRPGSVSPNARSTSPADDAPRTSRPGSSAEQRDTSTKVQPGQNTAVTSARGDTSASPSSRLNQTIQSLPATTVISTAKTTSTTRDLEQEKSQTPSSNQSDLRLGPTKAMSVPSKPINSKTPMTVYDDTDDDDLSDISERSREEDTSDAAVNKNLQSTATGLKNDSKNKPFPDSSKTSATGSRTPDTSSDFADKKSFFEKSATDKRAEPSTDLNVDKQGYPTAATARPVVKARAIEPSDSEDTTSGADPQLAKQTSGDTFYSPNESVDEGDDTDEQRSDSSTQRTATGVNQARSFGNQQRKANDSDEESDSDEDKRSDDSSSTGSQTTPAPSGKMALATIPLSEFKNHGYELHDIQLLQPTETSPVGLKLTKQQDPVQYIITAVAKGTKAESAGLEVNDWLIKIEDKDVRQVEFSTVSQEIRQLLTNAGLINMVIARKKASSSTSVKPVDKQPASASLSSNKQTDRQPTPPSTRSESVGRQQGGQAPSLFTTDITRDTPDSNQVRFTPDQSGSSPTDRSRSPPASTREAKINAPGGPLSVGLTNRIPDDNQTKSPRSQSRSPAREYTISQQQKTVLTDQAVGGYDPADVRAVVLKEALGLDFNSFIPEGTSQIQTHFISNVQPSSMADTAGLRDGDRILTVNDVDVTKSVHEDVRRMMQSKKPLKLTVVNDPKYIELIQSVKFNQSKIEGTRDKTSSPPPNYESVEQPKSSSQSDTNVRARAPIKSVGSDSGSDLNVPGPKSDSPNASDETLKKYQRALFTDDKGPVQVKHCLLKKDPNYNGYGLLLRYQNGLHLIDQVEEGSPAHNAGLREDDVILSVDKNNVEEMTHDDVKIMIRKLAVSNTNIDLVLIRKTDMPRYKDYQEKNSLDWESIVKDKLTNENGQSGDPPSSSVVRSSNDQTNTQRTSSSSSSSGKQPAPLPPASATSRSAAAPSTRTCTLVPSATRTAGFALSGKSAPPYIICQIEKDSPAEKAGLALYDALLSINGESVTETSYENTVKLIKEALQKQSVELVVRESTAPNQSKTSSSSQDQEKVANQPSLSDQSKSSMASSDSTNLRNSDASRGPENSHGSVNAVEEYQKQRNKELSYTLRLCHLHPTNHDNTQAATFGFELSEEPGYKYPLILRVEPQSSAEGAGLQSRDILLKINDRKTKGLGYEKVKKEIEKAKRDGRLEMLVVDQETYDYCIRTDKPLKEPEMKVKHIFPKSRSGASFPKLPIATATTSMSSRDSIEKSYHSTTRNDDNIPSYQRPSTGYHLSTSKETDSENEEDRDQTLSKEKSSSINPSQAISTHTSPPPVKFDLSTPTITSAHAYDDQPESPLKFFDPKQTTTQQASASSTNRQSVPSTARSTPSLAQASAKESKTSKAKAIPNAINSLFHKIGHPKSSKPDYDAPSKPPTSVKTRAPSPPTVRVGHNRLEASRVSQSLDTVASNATTAPTSSIHDTVRSTISTGSFDYLRGPRRCVLKVDRNRGLGFVLSATGDYDHTITAVEKNSAADIAGLQINDEVVEVDGVDVRNVKYEQVVDMLVAAMRTNDSIEMRVADGRPRDVYSSTTDADKQANPNSFLNSNNNNNVATAASIHSHRTAVSGDDLSDINSSISAFDSLNQQKFNTSYPNLPGQLRQLDKVNNRALSGSVPTLATGITASPSAFHQTKSISTSSEKGSVTKLSDISTQEAPVARLCRIRKFTTSPFYGFFLCGDPKKLGRVFISDVTKHSPAAVCGLRDGDRIIEINGVTIDTLTYETILDQIKQHMTRDDLELLVLDKKSVHWYRERNYPVTSRTLPTIVHIEPIINDTSSEGQSFEVPATHTKMVGFADRRVSKTGL